MFITAGKVATGEFQAQEEFNAINADSMEEEGKSTFTTLGLVLTTSISIIFGFFSNMSSTKSNLNDRVLSIRETLRYLKLQKVAGLADSNSLGKLLKWLDSRNFSVEDSDTRVKLNLLMQHGKFFTEIMNQRKELEKVSTTPPTTTATTAVKTQPALETSIGEIKENGAQEKLYKDIETIIKPAINSVFAKVQQIKDISKYVEFVDKATEATSAKKLVITVEKDDAAKYTGPITIDPQFSTNQYECQALLNEHATKLLDMAMEYQLDYQQLEKLLFLDKDDLDKNLIQKVILKDDQNFRTELGTLITASPQKEFKALFDELITTSSDSSQTKKDLTAQGTTMSNAITDKTTEKSQEIKDMATKIETILKANTTATNEKAIEALRETIKTTLKLVAVNTVPPAQVTTVQDQQKTSHNQSHLLALYMFVTLKKKIADKTLTNLAIRQQLATIANEMQAIAKLYATISHMNTLSTEAKETHEDFVTSVTPANPTATTSA